MAPAMLSLLALLPLGAAIVSESPVVKLVTMLKDMKGTLEKEQKADEETYAELQSWCKENEIGKSTEVADGESRIKELSSLVDELNASAASLATEMTVLAKEVKDATATLDQARVLHGNKVETFNADERSLYKDIQAVESAATVIGGVGGKLLQMPHDLKDVAAHLQDAVSRRSERLDNSLSVKDHELLEAFFSDPKSFVKGQSLLQWGGELSGMFEAMTDDFKSDLKTLQVEMAKEKKTYEDLMASKKDEIKAGESNLESKRQQRVEKRQSMMEAGFEIKNIQKAIGTSQEFLALVEQKCGKSVQDMGDRQKTRKEEIESVAKAIEILGSEEAQQSFGKTYSFLQKDQRLQRASQALAKVGVHMAISNSGVKGMEKVLTAIAGMSSDLKKEMQAEVEQRDFCVDSFNANKVKVAEVTSLEEKHDAKTEMLAAKLKTVASEISETKGKMEENKKELQKAVEEHEKELSDFNTTLVDQNVTQSFLAKAMASIKGTYLENPKLLQTWDTPEGFKDYKKSASGNAVMQLLQKIILDTKAMQGKTLRAKKSAEKDFKKLAEASQKDLDALVGELESEQSVKANANEAMVAAKADLKGAQKELANLATEEANLHESCDFVMKNFKMRQEARTEELEGLQRAKSILSGGSFLQKRF